MPVPNKLSSIGEFGFIRYLQRHMEVKPSVVKGIGDDAAVVDLTSKQYLLLTTDMLMEGVHFTKKHLADRIGHKAMACNISDIAAMGGAPQYALVSLGISGQKTIDFARKLYQGMRRTAQKYGVCIVGGDTIQSRKTIINVSLTGVVDRKNLVTRDHAQVGDQIFVTGPLGRSYSTGHHLKFTPRLLESHFLVKNYRLNAMIDVSDGLACDLGHILDESRRGAVIYENQIPRRRGASIHEALYDGEDFELIFTVPKQQAQKLKRHFQRYRFYPIGEITPQNQGFVMRRRNGAIAKILKKGYRHF